MARPIVAGKIVRNREGRFVGHALISCGVVTLLTYVGFVLRMDSLTIGCLYLLLVVTVASLSGFWIASFTSFGAVAMLDYFFVPPLFSFQIANPADWMALGIFEVAALVVSRQSAKQRRSANDAVLNRKAMEQLYELSRTSLLLDMRKAPGPQLVILIQRIFGATGVALFDINSGHQDRAGEWNAGEEDIAKECFLRGAGKEGPQAQTSERLLMVGSKPVGALVVRGDLSPLLVDALASLAAIAVDRHQWIEKEERAENAGQSERLRGAVMDALAHEFKTPLTAMQTASSGLLVLGELSAAQLDLVTLIDGETARLSKLCTRLLQTAELEAGKVGLEKENVNLHKLVLEVLATQPAQSERDRMQLVMDDPDLTVRVDRELLSMILAQYLDNARKYSTPHTPIEIATRISRAEVLISVHNFGSTIRIEDRERIFDRFYRAPDMKGIAPGTGIGLSVVRKAAEANHGHVWAISDEKEGTTFFLSLPTEPRRTL